MEEINQIYFSGFKLDFLRLYLLRSAATFRIFSVPKQKYKEKFII